MPAVERGETSTRLRPKDFLEAPKSFGKRPDARWVVGPETPRGLLAAAWLQHQAALVVHYESMRRRGGVADLARKLGKDGDYLRRKLHGERWANVRDLADWMLEVGHEVLPQPRSDHEVLPPPEFTVASKEEQ